MSRKVKKLIKETAVVIGGIAWVLSVIIVWNKTENGAVTVALIFSFPFALLLANALGGLEE